MATSTAYLRPYQDKYLGHKTYPVEHYNNQSGYSLINESNSDGQSTYICCYENNHYGKKRSYSEFYIKGDFPSTESFINIEEAKAYAVFASSGTSEMMGTTVRFQLIISVILNNNTYKSSIYSITNTGTSSFTLPEEFLKDLENYIDNYHQWPQIVIGVDTEMSAEGKNPEKATGGITQLYLKIDYHLGLHLKRINSWTPISRLYEKIDNSWKIIDSNNYRQILLNKTYPVQRGHRLAIKTPAISPTCTTAGSTAEYYCYDCGEIYTTINSIAALGHSPYTVEEIAATCGEVGKTSGTKCSRCSMILSGCETIPATGAHTETTVSGTAATCGVSGKTDGTKCSECGQVLVAQETIPATGAHTITDTAAVEPTCGQVGYTAGTQCSTCKTYFSGHTEIAATGNHTEVATEEIAATCSSTGSTGGTHCSVCNKVLTKPTTIAKLPHTPEVIPAINATCGSHGYTEGSKCSVCGTILIRPDIIPPGGLEGHSFIDSGDGYHRICEKCGYIENLGMRSINAYSTNLRLMSQREGVAVARIGDYGFFAGGHASNVTADVDVFNSSLTKYNPTGLSVARYYAVGAVVANTYAIFAGGSTAQYPKSGTASNAVDIYNTSLTRTITTTLSTARYDLAATSIGNYAIFGGGNTGDATTNIVEIFDNSLTKIIGTSLTAALDGLAATTTINGYAIFAGGTNVDAYSTSLTKTHLGTLTYADRYIAATTIGKYSIFAGGSQAENGIDIFNTSLTHTISTNGMDVVHTNAVGANVDSPAMRFPCAGTIGNQAIFAAGSGINIRGGSFWSSGNTNATFYNQSLIKSVKKLFTNSDLTRPGAGAGMIALNNYLIISGGGYCDASSDNKVVYIFTIN